MDAIELAPLSLEPIKARMKGLSAGPWEVMGVNRHIIGNSLESADRVQTGHHQWTHNTTPQNAEFIANARQDVPALIAEIERLRDIFLAVANNFENCSHDDALLLARQYRAVARGER